MTSKRLILRLSSLGDVILATSALEAIQASQSTEQSTDWVISKDYSELLRNHPKINQLLEFDRSLGLKGWIRFCRTLWESQYNEIYDLHGSLRTKVMKILFRGWSLTEGRHFPKWKSISKGRLRLYCYFLLKGLWPKSLRPTPWVVKFSRRVGGTGREKPDLTHLIQNQTLPPELIDASKNTEGKYLCVMPSSRWDGKKWPVENYLQVLKKFPYLPVILGSKSDKESIHLVEKLQRLGIPYFSGVGKWGLTQTASILKNSVGYLGGDTGLAHLAESVGASATVIFGPTQPDMGFGPWRKNSRSIGMSLWCRPCGKDGRSCFRIKQRHLCLKALSAETVLKNLGDL